MSLIKEINDSLREKDPVELALETCGAKHENEEVSSAASCKQYMNPARAKDFAKAIAGEMSKGMSYGDAKAKVFDETEMPPAKSPCCKYLRTLVDQVRKESVSESEVITEARRKVSSKKSQDGSREAIIYRDAEWEEFQVEFFQDGKKQDKATYHTDDKQDAVDTAQGFISKRF